MLLEGLEAMVRAGVRHPLWPVGSVNGAAAMDRNAVLAALPHREPFLFVDEIAAVDVPGMRIRCRRHLAPDDAVFTGHFPGQPVYPGVLQLEMIGQAGLCLLHAVGQSAGANVRAVRVHHAVFLNPAGPRDSLDIVAKVVRSDEFGAICAGQVLRDGTICTFGVMEVFFAAN